MILFILSARSKTEFLQKAIKGGIIKLKVKRILAMVLCVAMVFSTMSFGVLAEENTETPDEIMGVSVVDGIGYPTLGDIVY